MILGDSTMKDLKIGLKKARTLIVPYGTAEAHGDHLPCETDALIVREVVNKVAKITGAVAAPTIPYGVCTSTADHQGTLGISAGTLRAFTLDIVRDAIRKGFDRIILVSGHGGSLHSAAMREAAEILVAEHKKVVIASFTLYDLIEKGDASFIETPNDSHAGEAETSLVLYLAPSLVKGRSKAEYPRFNRPFVERDKLKAWKGAVWGDPSKATAQKGELLFNLLVDKVCSVVRAKP